MASEEEKAGEELLAAVEWWQANDQLHPLTCEEHQDVPLEPLLNPATWRVYLFCNEDKCKYCQAWVPEVVLDAYRNRNNTAPKA